MAKQVKYNNRGKPVWLCEECFKKEKEYNKYDESRMALVSDQHNPNKHPLFCFGYDCHKPLVDLQTIVERGRKDKPAATRVVKDRIQSIYHFLKLLNKMEPGVPCVLQWKKKWVACVPLEFSRGTRNGNGLPWVRLGIIAKNPARKWGDDFFCYSSKLPLTIEPLKEEDIPMMIGQNEGTWMGRLLKGDLDEV